MTVALVHLSDIHFKKSSDRVCERVRAIAATLNGFPTLSTVVVTVTGDVAFSGTEKEYEVAKAFLQTSSRAFGKVATPRLCSLC